MYVSLRIQLPCQQAQTLASSGDTVSTSLLPLQKQNLEQNGIWTEIPIILYWFLPKQVASIYPN